MTRPRPVPGDHVLIQARVLADPTRLAVLRLLESAAGALRVREVADAMGLHPNTVRQHLGQLRDAALVVEEVEHDGAPGRPALRYRSRAGADASAGWDAYQQVVLWLLQAAAGRPARAVGAEAGHRLAVASGGPQGAAGPDSVAMLEQAFRLQGFDPVVEHPGDGTTELVLRSCPFAESAAVDRTVCDLHLGLAEGLAAAVGTDRVTELRLAPPDRGRCSLVLAPLPHPGGSS
ncbi:MAG TPA: helix-turn-helix domain-containing protein [Acidimicrobiales bacterium]|nr:helix-turn-helix domain-containing protein [Acidimicrobiales bacterium]